MIYLHIATLCFEIQVQGLKNVNLLWYWLTSLPAVKILGDGCHLRKSLPAEL